MSEFGTAFKPGDPGHTDEHNRIGARLNIDRTVFPAAGEVVLRAALLAGGVIRLRGVYDITRPLVLANDAHVLCAPLTVIRAVAEMDAMLTLETASALTQHLHIHNLTLDGNGLATRGALLYQVCRAHTTSIDGLVVRNTTGDGITLRVCQTPIFQALRAENCGGAGIIIEGCNGARFYGVSAFGNAGTGIVVRDYPQGEIANTGGLAGMFGVHSERNGGHGLLIAARSQVAMWGSWIELNALDGVRISGLCALLSGLGISGVGTGDNYAIHVTDTAAGVTVRDCWLQRAAGSTMDYARVIVEPGATGLNLTPNYNRYNGAEIEAVYLAARLGTSEG